MADFQTSVETTKFYNKDIWDICRLDSIVDQCIADEVYQFACLKGAPSAAKILQEVINQPQDGIIGRDTIGMVNTSDDYNLICELYKAKRLEYESNNG